MDMKTSPLSALNDPSLLKTDALVGGQWVAGASRFDVNDPATGGMKPVGGVRGAVERNAMRYYLAIDAYLNNLDAADKRINAWFSATERYAKQLHEMDRATYVNMKRTEVERQQTALAN